MFCPPPACKQTNIKFALLSLVLCGCAAGFPATVRRAAAHFETPQGRHVGPLAVNTWSTNGPAGNPAIFALAMDPTNAAIIYAASRALVYKSTDGGATWNAGTGVGVADYNGLAIARTDPNVLYATGGGTVYKSTDAGATWNPTNLASVFSGIGFSRHGLAVDPTNANIAYVGTTRASDFACEVYKTTDGGATWVGTGLPVSSAISIAIDPQNRNIIYAGTFNGVTNGVWKTTAGGNNWAPTGPLGHQVWALAIDPNSSNVLYAGSSFDTANDSIWKTTNSGASWTPINNGLTDPISRAIAVDPSNPNILYLSTVITAGSGLWKSTDGGASWNNFNVNLSPNTGATSLLVDPTGQFLHRGLNGVFDLKYGPPCQFSISPNSVDFSTSGGTTTVAVTASDGCAWSATTTAPWISISSGSVNGIGNGSVVYTVAANATTTPRTGTITIAGLTHTVTQAGCAYSVTPTNPNLPFFAGILVLSVNTTSPCAWTSSNNGTTWLTPLTPTSGSTAGVARFFYQLNLSAAPRTAALTVAGQSISVTQGGMTLTPPFILGRIADASANGQRNVTVTLSGAVTQATRTDEQGNYAFAGLPTGANANFTVTPTSPYNNFSPAQTTVTALSGNRVIDFAPVSGAITTPTPALTDDFAGTTRNASRWNLGTLTQPNGAFDPQVTVAQQNGRLVVTPLAGMSGPHYNGYVSVNAFDFINARASVEVPQVAAGGGETIFGLGSDNNNYFRFVVGPSNSPSLAAAGTQAPTTIGVNDVAPVLVFQVKIGGVVTQQVIPYDPVAHRFWRFRHDAPVNALLFETSPDNSVFTERFRKTLDKPISALAVELTAGTATPGSGGAANFDNLSLVTSSGQFFNATASVSEDAARATITVTRAGNINAAPASLVYATVDDPAEVACADTRTKPGVAFARCDYATSVDTVSFAAGETSKTFTVPIIDDIHVEGSETFQLVLRSASGVSVGAPAIITVTIADNDTAGRANPIFTTPFFVRMQYLDFLSREPEQSEPWSRVLNNCPDVNNVDPTTPSAGCDRLSVSSSFFGSPEFRLKGFYVFTFYQVAFAGLLPEYAQVIPDMRGVTGSTAEETLQKRARFAVDFVARPEFKALYDAKTNAEYVQALLARYNVAEITTRDPQNPDGTQTVMLTATSMANNLTAGTLSRAQVLRAVVESQEVGQAEFNRAFVAMQYYGYLRRKPEDSGYQSWLRYLIAHPDDFRTMVNGFMNSTEYKLRFGQP